MVSHLLPPRLLLLMLLGVSAFSDCPPFLRPTDTDDPHPCRPKLVEGGLAGAQNVTVFAPSGCRCQLSLQVLDYRGVPMSAKWNQSLEDGAWTAIDDDDIYGETRLYAVAYEGWYQPVARRCQCQGANCAGCNVSDGVTFRREKGLRAEGWSLSMAVTQLPGCGDDLANCRISVSIGDQWQYGSVSKKFYFPRLHIYLVNRSSKQEHKQTTPKRIHKTIDWSPNDTAPIEFADVRPGNYVVEVWPKAYNCRGYQDKCPKVRSDEFNVLRSETPNPSQSSSHSDNTGLYIGLGVLVGLAVSVTVLYLLYQARRNIWPRLRLPPPQATPEKPPADYLVPVMVFQRAGGDDAWQQERKRLVAELNQRGLRVLDAQEGDMRRMLVSYGSLAGVLAQPALLAARLLFIHDYPPLLPCPNGAENGSVEALPRRRDDTVYEHALCHVRNTRNGQDYRRVFVCTLQPGGCRADQELVGLTEGRVFCVAEQGDLDCLVSHLSAPSAASSPVAWTDNASTRFLLTPSAASLQEGV